VARKNWVAALHSLTVLPCTTSALNVTPPIHGFRPPGRV
jgi:hypothetical protein